MTRMRSYGQDLPFCDWLRHHEGLPAASADCGFVATDVDLAIHRYLTDVSGTGTREVQNLMQLEVKTRGGEPPSSQLDTLYKQHCLCCRQLQLRHQSLLHFGVAVLSLDGTHPQDSTTMRWGRFRPNGQLRWRLIDDQKLLQLLRFELDPDTFVARKHYRDANDDSIVLYEATPDGQEIPTQLIKQGTHATTRIPTSGRPGCL